MQRADYLPKRSPPSKGLNKHSLGRDDMHSQQMVEPGTKAPDFELPDANGNPGGEMRSLHDVLGENGAVVFFTCNHCPYVVGSEPRIESAAEVARKNGLGFAGINSNDPVKYESDSWDNMVKRANKGMTYPYLHDSSQEVALAYGAERTPEFYLLNSDSVVVYRGRLDDSPRDPSHATTSELEDAIEELATGKTVSVPRTESMGCSVKWKE